MALAIVVDDGQRLLRQRRLRPGRVVLGMDRRDNGEQERQGRKESKRTMAAMRVRRRIRLSLLKREGGERADFVAHRPFPRRIA